MGGNDGYRTRAIDNGNRYGGSTSNTRSHVSGFSFSELRLLGLRSEKLKSSNIIEVFFFSSFFSFLEGLQWEEGNNN